MGDFSIEKILISGVTLASLLHRSSASSGDLHGFLFGHVVFSDSTPLSDDDATATTGPSLTATITSFISLPSHLPLPLPITLSSSSNLLGWFSSRRKTPLRPSLRDSLTTLSLSSSSSSSLTFTPHNSTALHPPSLFLLLTTPLQDKLIHTHEYKTYEYCIPSKTFEPKSLNIINIGPSFRSHYDSFSPNVPFPLINCDLRGSNAMVEDEECETLEAIRRALKNQKKLDMCAEGFEIGRMSKLVGSEAANYMGELEDLYDKMLCKIDALSKLVEQTSAKVVGQENHNMKLRYKVAGID
ncbi:uncharacterized protein LOC111405953 [Olea europaea var. sylvestris]|uniref:uncharacterized protein LOC111405953 n=1 Tax=Olea europaea var. sylvestris TaxID=158386 RepID=UPI000C1D1497|nr:uncharacterized protein LOC111405953 [Olea europaea var. sylvestris]XP_022890853.1 uncharacterized protein LOC111405953 [Olea europaea var. sylvestris]